MQAEKYLKWSAVQNDDRIALLLSGELSHGGNVLFYLKSKLRISISCGIWRKLSELIRPALRYYAICLNTVVKHNNKIKPLDWKMYRHK